ncbi:hypothetical protein ZWY2020_003215 [Hordeum vulgare]|nr:hypothetical protein ZWY2020_003215 [Hordeum vulgare]
MVSWNDGETSEDSALNLCSSCDSILKLPTTMHGPNINGTDKDVKVLCEHGKPTERFVTFEGMHTGRRFWGCSEKRVVDSVGEYNLKDNTNLQQKYDILKNLPPAQAKVIRNLKNNYFKEMERLTEERYKL